MRVLLAFLFLAVSIVFPFGWATLGSMKWAGVNEIPEEGYQIIGVLGSEDDSFEVWSFFKEMVEFFNLPRSTTDKESIMDTMKFIRKCSRRMQHLLISYAGELSHDDETNDLLKNLTYLTDKVTNYLDRAIRGENHIEELGELTKESLRFIKDNRSLFIRLGLIDREQSKLIGRLISKDLELMDMDIKKMKERNINVGKEIADSQQEWSKVLNTMLKKFEMVV